MSLTFSFHFRRYSIYRAASGGDGATNHETLEVLASAQREVSPTRFHNSVHNAPSGYWAVATGSRAPSSSLCAFDGSFAAGFLEAAVQAAVDHRPVTLIAYDTPYPEPLGSVRRIGSVFAVALVLAPHRTSKSLAALTLEVEGSGSHEAGMADADLERLRIGNPAAFILPGRAYPAVCGGGAGARNARALSGIRPAASMGAGSPAGPRGIGFALGRSRTRIAAIAVSAARQSDEGAAAADAG